MKFIPHSTQTFVRFSRKKITSQVKTTLRTIDIVVDDTRQ